MIRRGLLPDFSPAVLAETDAVRAPRPKRTPRSATGVLWCSIDHHDSRDLDQLSVAEPTTRGTVTIRVAVADVDAGVREGSAIDGHARTNTTSVYTAAEIFPMLLEEALDGSDMPRRGTGAPGDRDRDGSRGRRYGHGIRRPPRRRAEPGQARHNSVAAWLDGIAPAPPPLSTVAGLDQQLRIQDKVAQAMKGLRHQHGALSLDTLEAGACSMARCSTISVPTRGTGPRS